MPLRNPLVGIIKKVRPALERNEPVPHASFAVGRWIFVRWLAAIYLIAFLSLWMQIHGLIGANGVSPVGEFLSAAYARFGERSRLLLPTLLWFSSGDAALNAVCAAGALACVLVLAGILQPLSLLAAWACYLSLVTGGQLFLSFQWDILLLETGVLACLLAPVSWRSRLHSDGRPARPAVFLMHWLLFRLMFASGVVKLASGDPVWRNLTALAYHYETQPLPMWTSWYAHHLPLAVHRFSCAAMFGVELVLPFFIFGPKIFRRTAAGGIILFQLLILATGNYAFFNWLTIGLCVLLLDDACWPQALRRRVESAASPGQRPSARGWPAWLLAPIAAVLILLSVVPLASLRRRSPHLPEWLLTAYEYTMPFHLVNGYGLFAVMTTQRHELIVEGSRDGKTWEAYEFRYKPGDPSRPPRFAAPHQPRLDWQMWFAALGSYPQNPWVLRFAERLLEGSPDVLRLLARNPFADAPPKFIRVMVDDYHFSSPQERRASGIWWTRKRLGAYCPVLSLKD